MAVKHEDLANFGILKNHLENKAKTKIRIWLLWWLRGEGNGNPFQYSCLENPTDKGAWRATIHGVAKSAKMHN